MSYIGKLLVAELRGYPYRFHPLKVPSYFFKFFIDIYMCGNVRYKYIMFQLLQKSYA